MDRNFWAIIAVIIVGFIGVVMYNNQQEASSDKNDPVASKGSENFFGKKDSPVKFVEYADYQCPACASFSPMLKQVREAYADKVSFQFRNYPLTQIHPNAFAASRAAEAAGLQGKFWEMHDLLYEQQNWGAWTSASNPTSLFESYARQLDLDIAKFTADSRGEVVNAIINADRDAFEKTGETPATPTFFLNGKVLDSGALLDDKTQQPSADKFGKILDDALAAAAKQ